MFSMLYILLSVYNRAVILIVRVFLAQLVCTTTQQLHYWYEDIGEGWAMSTSGMSIYGHVGAVMKVGDASLNLYLTVG